jgi:hypothetical protein
MYLPRAPFGFDCTRGAIWAAIIAALVSLANLAILTAILLR